MSNMDRRMFFSSNPNGLGFSSGNRFDLIRFRAELAGSNWIADSGFKSTILQMWMLGHEPGSPD